MSLESPRRVAVIGGGLSGLATAVKLSLADPSIELTLFEAAERPGGVIHTERDRGYLIDHGADMFATKPSAALDLCRQLNVESQLIEPEQAGRGARIVFRSRLIPLPSGFVLMRATQLMPMLTTPLLSIRGKLRFLMERMIAPRPSKEKQEDESVASFVRRRMGQEVLDRIVAPLAAGIYTADITKLSMNATMGNIAEMERKYGSLAKATAARRRSGEDSVERMSTGARYGQFRAFAGGMVELINTLVAALPSGTLHLNSPIRSLQRRDERWLVTTERGEGVEFDHVVVAVPPRRAALLLDDIVPDAADELRSIESASTAIVVLGAKKSDIRHDIKTFGFVVPLTEGRRILAGSFASNKFAGRAPDDQVLIRSFVGGSMQPELLELTDDELVELVREELRELIGLEGEPILTRVVRWDHAMPQYHVGHQQRVERIENAISQTSGISLITNAMHGVGIAPVIASADRVANQVLASFTRSGDATGSDSVGSGHGA